MKFDIAETDLLLFNITESDSEHRDTDRSGHDVITVSNIDSVPNCNKKLKQIINMCVYVYLNIDMSIIKL